MNSTRSKANPRDEYEAALDAYGSGATWNEKASYWGTAFYSSGINLSQMDTDKIPDDIVDEIKERIVADIIERNGEFPGKRHGDMRRGVISALQKRIVYAHEHGRTGSRRFAPQARREPPPKLYPSHVRTLIGDLEESQAGNIDWVRELSPCLDWLGQSPEAQFDLFIRAAFKPDELLYIFRNDPPTAGIIGRSIRKANDWTHRAPFEPIGGECIVPNPLTGKAGMTGEGKRSLISADCIAAYNYIVIEFDDIKYCPSFGGDGAKGLAAQYAFWRNFILRDPLAPALVSLTYSGGKSLHGLLYIGSDSLDDWKKGRNYMVSFYASDPLKIVSPPDVKKDIYPFRADIKTMHQRHGTRLPGVLRRDNNTMQELVYLNPKARCDDE